MKPSDLATMSYKRLSNALAEGAKPQEDSEDGKPQMSARFLEKLRENIRKQKFEEGDERGVKVQRSKIRLVERHMRDRVSSGIEVMRRVPGTGELVEETRTYNDTPANRKAGRSGKTYTVKRWKNAQYAPHKRKSIRSAPEAKRRRSSDKPKVKNSWIQSIEQAKKELNATGFVKICAVVKDPEDDAQKVGHAVYMRAKELQRSKKEEAAKSGEAAMTD
jgi:hypothetical protein